MGHMLTSLSVRLPNCQSHSDLRTSSMLYGICKPNLNNRCKLELIIFTTMYCTDCTAIKLFLE